MKINLTVSLSLFFLTIFMFSISSCKKDDDPAAEVIASFYFEVDADNYKQVQFNSTSQNYSTLSWDFGDGNTSTEENPVHIYDQSGDYTVILTATSSSDDSTDDFTELVSISDPNELLTTLAGEDTKTWKLLRETTNGRYPLEVGPADYSTIWWAVGLNNDEIANRPCMFNDEWTFGRDGSMVYDSKGDYWAEGGIFTPDNICASTADPMVSANGEDLSAWAAGNHTFELETGAEPTITAIGTGAFIGFFKSATEYEVTKLDPMVQEEVTYNIVKLSEGDVDTLIVEALYKFEVGDVNPGGYWRFILVHYDNPEDEPDLPGNAPSPNFSMEIDGTTISFINNSQFADSYLWEFGDGNTSTEENPVHTYATDGIYTVTLSATNAIATNMATATAFVSGTELTNDLLMGDPWRIVVDDKTVFVGSGMGKSDWWSVPKAFLDGSSSDGDDWSCMADDEFTFGPGNVFTYETNGFLRNDGYMGSPNGCMAEADLTGNGLAFGSGSHTYELTPASGDQRPLITLTNGADKAAFIGFYKGYYGGENTDSNNLPNGGNATNLYEVMGYANSGTKEYLFVSVDITGDHSATASWSVILER